MKMLTTSTLALSLAAGGAMIAPQQAGAQAMTSMDIKGMKDDLIRNMYGDRVRLIRHDVDVPKDEAR